MKTFIEYVNENTSTTGVDGVEARVNTVERYRRAAYIDVDGKSYDKIKKAKKIEEIVADDTLCADFLIEVQKAYAEADCVLLVNRDDSSNHFLKTFPAEGE